MARKAQRKTIVSLGLRLMLIISGSTLLLSLQVRAGPGAELYNELLEKGVIYPDGKWQSYVTEVGERLLAVSSHADKTYTFSVVDEPIVNAWATPDAYIFVTRGILAYFRTEDELANVLGHEIAHVILRHSRKQVASSRISGIAGILGAFATGSGSTIPLAQSLKTTALASYGRKFELQADELGVELARKAGYDPRASIDSIQILRDHDAFRRSVSNAPPVYHGLLGSHPAHEKRLHELVQKNQGFVLAELPGPERDYLAMLDGLRFGADSAIGVAKDSVYYHGALRMKIAFPDGWDIQSTDAEVFARSPDRQSKISVRRSALPSEPQTPKEYLEETLQRDDLENGELVRAGPYSGYLADIVNPGTQKFQRSIAIIYKDGDIYLFEGENQNQNPLGDFKQQFKVFVTSLRPMTADDMRMVNKQTIALVEAKPGDTYAKLARGVPIRRNAEETLRLINGHYPRGEPRAGDRIKVVR
jgi:predicted Zn-dependent protease|tara:strand:- start:333 stop:1757 length:1425 start_codon:yes stop_codon:yes gene_type:complete